MPQEIKLGSKVKDLVTDFVGIATCRSEYMNGCVRYLVEGKVNKEGKSHVEYFDAGQLIVLDGQSVLEGKAVAETGKVPGGPGRAEAPRI